MLTIKQRCLLLLLGGAYLNLILAADSDKKPMDRIEIETDAYLGAKLNEESASNIALNGEKNTSFTNEAMNLTIKLEGGSVVAYWHQYVDLFATYKEPVWKDSVEKWKISFPPNTRPADIFVHLDHNGRGRIDATREYAVVYVKKKIHAVVDLNSGDDLMAEYWRLLERRMDSTKAMDRAWSRDHPHQDGCWKALGE